MKKASATIILLFFVFTSFAQRGETEEKTGKFKKENLFTGGSLVLSFSSYTTVLGGSPVLGYSINKWLDAGVQVNFTYSSNRHAMYYNPNTGQYFYSDDKLKQTTYGGGAFLKIYPVNFLFLQAQGEYNSTSVKLIPANGGTTEKSKTSAPSFLVGAGYCNGRQGVGSLFYYVSVLADIAKDKDSPYTEVTASGTVNVLPIFRAGLQIPLFQGRGRRRG